MVTAAAPKTPARILCLGEALVDLICERPLSSLLEADSFVPHFGGAVANVAVAASQAGAQVTLAGGVGEDEWGRWLEHRLLQEGVDTSLFELVADRQTPVAFALVDERGEARYQIYGEAIETAVEALEERIEPALRSSKALFISSNTLVGEDERTVTMKAREVALDRGAHVVFDPNIRLHRWRSRASAAASANACVPQALLVRANRDEAELLTGEADPERAALALLKAGARLVVITLGAGGAILRGELRADATGVPARVLSTIGAGDVFTGVLLARLAQSDFYPSVVAAALPDAVKQATKACERWGALD